MKIRVLILVILLVAFGIQGASYGLSVGFVGRGCKFIR